MDKAKRKHIPLTFTLRGSGVALPDKIVSSQDIDNRMGKTAGWTEANFQIAHRHWASGNETSSYLGAKAAKAALKKAEWKPSDLDVIIGACGVMEQPIPGTATLIQQKLGLGRSGIPAFDVNATCLSFLLALRTAVNGFALGSWHNALIVGADIATAALNFDDPEASVIFGDGAYAIALEAGHESEMLAWHFSTFGDGAALCQLPAGGTRLRLHDDTENFFANSYFQMDGPGVFKATGRRFPRFLKTIFEQAGMKAEEIDLVVPHQASAAALEHLKRALPNGHDKTIDIYRNYGNQIATSMPHALHYALESGRIKAGERSLLVGSSAGISIGGAIIQW